MIPTRDRPESLGRTLAALSRQTRPPEEIIVVDAGDPPLGAEALASAHPGLPVTVLRAAPGVCAQRNIGIRRATGSHVLLCDDDIELPPAYLDTLCGYLAGNPDAGAATGSIHEPDGHGGFGPGFSAPSLRHLLFAFVFQLTVWADVDALATGPLGTLPASFLRWWYRRRGNTWSLAGWPLVTRICRPTFRTATYGLGAALVRRDWLLASPYDERLGSHGIGDNYGVALGFPGDMPIAVLVDLPARHHRAAEHRAPAAEAFLRRALALDYFLRTSGRFPVTARAWLVWSLVGKAIVAAAGRRGDMLRATVRALALVATSRNPLLAAVSRPADGPDRARRTA